MAKPLDWVKVLGPDELPEGRVTQVAAGRRALCMTRYKGRYGALDNHCPHQGGPLGEGAIENGELRCPWHGWEFDPITGKAPGFDDGVQTFPVEERDDGVYVGIERDEAQIHTVGDLMMETMVNWGVRWVFGMLGHSNLGVAEALRKLETAGRLKYIGIRHEGAASFACSAYGKLTGRPAACLSIAGPGATNMLTGLWDAHMDRAPVLALTGQVNTQFLGPGAFQEIDLAGAYGSVAQWSQTVLPNSAHAELMNLALKKAITNRGVSHLIFPDEAPKAAARPGAEPGTPEGRLSRQEISPPEAELENAEKMIRRSRRPVIIAGHGARFSMEPVIELAELLKCPVLTTFKAKGQIPDGHPLAAGVLGRSGTPVASWAMNASDTLIVFGASFSQHTGITKKKPTVQVDFDRQALSKSRPVKSPVWGEVGVTARLLRERLREGADTEDQRPDLAERWKIWRDEKQNRARDGRGGGVNSALVFGALSRLAPDDAIITVDVGSNAYSFGRYFECERQSIVLSGYLGSIGYAFPAAMGAWAAAQEDDPLFAGRKVISVSGDGGFGQYMAEYTTAVRYGMNITHVLLNNGELGKISREQRMEKMEVWQTSLANPCFADFASMCGGMGIRVEKADEIENAISRALAHAGPSLVEIIIEPGLT